MVVKKKKSKDKAESNPSNDGSSGFATLEDKMKHLESINKSLEMQLAYQSEKTSSAMTECRSMHSKMVEEKSMSEENRKLTLDLARDMTRQYKAMEEQLLSRINDRENVLQDTVDEFAKARAIFKTELQHKQDQIKSRDNEISILKNNIDRMNDDFVSLLKNLGKNLLDMVDLDFIRRQGLIKATASEDEIEDGDSYFPIQRKMEKLGCLKD